MNLNLVYSALAVLALFACALLRIRYLKSKLERVQEINAELSESVIALNKTLGIYRKEKAAREKNRDEADSKISSIDNGGIDAAVTVLQDCGNQD
ncbi:hypothetical protein [Treponema succinifaciens]|uniref:hypothetical protein n=1 Tax=Treponema succinifaciens TaxID=167 RepID=UPI003FEFCC98